jgi:hypothetical protein
VNISVVGELRALTISDAIYLVFPLSLGSFIVKVFGVFVPMLDVV